MGKYDDVKLFEYIERRNRMLDDSGRVDGTCNGVLCTKCPLYKKDVGCLDLEMMTEEDTEAIDIVMNYVPKVDWSKVHVDAKILVSHDKKTWNRRYFAKYEDGKVYAWLDGCTSFSVIEGNRLAWNYAKLAEDEK